MGNKGIRRKIWTEECILNFFNSSKNVPLSCADKDYYNSIAKEISENFSIDYDKFCKHKTWLYMVIECSICGYRAYRTKYQIENRSHQCYGCCVNNLSNKCKSKNYDLIDYLPHSDKSLVSCKSCGDKTECSKSAILGKNKIDCESCRIINYKECCNKRNVRYISHRRVKNGILVSIECPVCGSIDEKYSSSILSETELKFDCQKCMKTNYEVKVGNRFKFIQNLDYSSCEISCNTHNIVLKVSRSTVLRGMRGYECPLCVKDKLIKRLLARDCKWVSNNTNSTTYKGIDGSVFIRKNSSIYTGKFPVSQNHRRNQPFKLYLISVEYMSNIFIKLGIATDPEIRLKSLGIYSPVSLKTLRSFSTGSEAQIIEYKLFDIFSRYRVCSTIPSTFCSGIKRNKVDGATEWLDASVLSNGFYEVLDDLCCDPK